MKISTFVFITTLLLGAKSYAACDSGAAKVNDGHDGEKSLLICSDGRWKEPTTNQLVQFMNLAGSDAPNYARIMTEGRASNAQEFNALLGGFGPYENVPMTNVSYDGKVSAEQTDVLNSMAKKWNKVMEIKPQKAVDIFDIKKFNEASAKNIGLINDLAGPDKKCHSMKDGPVGFEVEFTDEEKMNLIPLGMTDIGAGKYKIRFMERGFVSPLSEIKERTIEIPSDGGNITWQSTDQNYFIRKQSFPELSTSNMFAAGSGMSMGGVNPLCRAEQEIESLFPPSETDGAPIKAQ